MSRELSIAEGIERTLAVEILRGTWAPGSRLPSLRKLAARFEVTVPTVQRVIAGLGTRGLVTAVQGSGVLVHDPMEVADPALLPLWFEARAHQPELASAMLGDFLELRRVVAGHLVETRLDKLQAALAELSGPAMVVLTSTDVAEIARADVALTRAFARASGSFAVTAVLGAVARLPEELPVLAEAFYGDRAVHMDAIQSVVDAVAGGAEPAEAARSLRVALARWDAVSVARFEALLRAGGLGS